MRADLVARMPHHDRAARLFAQGLTRHGVDWHVSPNVEGDADFAVCWGWRIGRRAAAANPGRPVLVLELGYVGDRHEWTSMGWDGLNGRAWAPQAPDGGLRWRRLFAQYMRPWNGGGKWCVIFGQVSDDASVAGVDLRAWYAEAAIASRCYGVPVVYRGHPLEHEARGPAGIEVLPRGPIEAVLARAAIAVTYNSNAGVDALLAGVHVVACDRGSMAWPLAGQRLGAIPPWQPMRARWAADLAWRQWSPAEIAAGEAWEFMRAGLGPRTAAQDEPGEGGQG